jgi:hypothetical protein
MEKNNDDKGLLMKIVSWFLKFFKPAWMSNTWSTAERAVEREKNQKKLAEIAKTAPLWATRRVAVAKLTDQIVLEEIARNDKHVWTSIDAAEKLNNQNIAQEIIAHWAMSNLDQLTCKKIVAKVTDQSILAYIALNSKKLRHIAAPMLTDPDAIAKIAMKQVLPNHALERLSKEVLKTIAENKSYNGLNAAILLNDQKLIWDNMPEDHQLNSEYIRKYITDQKILVDYIRKYLRFFEIQYHDEHRQKPIMAALEKITEQPVLADMARNAKDPDYRLAAASRLENKKLAQWIFAQVALRYKNMVLDAEHGYKAGKKAVELLSNHDLLVRVSKEADRPEVKKAALAKLRTPKDKWIRLSGWTLAKLPEPIFTEIKRFRQWTTLTPTKGYSEDEYTGWNKIYSCFEKFLNIHFSFWNDNQIKDILYIIAKDRDDDLARKIAKDEQRLFFLSKQSLKYGEAKWQLVIHLHDCTDKITAEEILKLFVQDEDEYVNRRALITLAKLGSKQTETYCKIAWDRDLYGERQEYQRIAVLYSLAIINSALLPSYIALAKSDGRQNLLKCAIEIENQNNSKP